MEEGKAVGPAVELQYRLLDKVGNPETLALGVPVYATSREEFTCCILLFGKVYRERCTWYWFRRRFLVYTPHRPRFFLRE